MITIVYSNYQLTAFASDLREVPMDKTIILYQGLSSEWHQVR